MLAKAALAKRSTLLSSSKLSTKSSIAKSHRATASSRTRHAGSSRGFVSFSDKPENRPKLVILGSGWASYRILQSLDFNKWDVTVVSPRNHFFFTPMLASTTTGVLEFRSIMDAIRTTHHEYEFIQGQARSVDFEAKTITCSEWMRSDRRFDLKWDKLIIGVGADNNTFGIPGVTPMVAHGRLTEEGNVFFLKELADARAIRNQIINNLEEASIPGIPPEERKRLLNFVVVGGGPTGVEFAAELSDFFWRDVLSYYPNISINELRITLLEAGNTILGAFSKTVVRQAMKNIKRQGIDMKLHTKVKEVRRNQIVLEDDTVIDCGMIVWSTGVGPRKFVRESQLPLDHGRLVVDGHLRLKDHPDVFALGDCASIEGNPLPATAQVANQQAAWLVKKLNGKGKIDSKTGKEAPFEYYPLGLMAYVGGSKSVFDTKLLKGTGILEFLAWRSVYLTRLGGWKNKLMVPYNWLGTLIWGRDVSRF